MFTCSKLFHKFENNRSWIQKIFNDLKREIKNVHDFDKSMFIDSKMFTVSTEVCS
jgi:hypothetical protein